MFPSYSKIPYQRSRAISVFIFVILVHIALIWTLSSLVMASHEPNASIKMLESFVMEDTTGQAAGVSTETLDPPVAAYEPVESPTPDEEDPEPGIPEPLILPTPESESEESKLSIPEAPAKKVHPKPFEKKTKSNQNFETKNTSHGSTTPSQTGSSDITLPVTYAKYLNNPHPAYPRQSKRFGEQGTVLLAIEIDVDGSASQVKVQKSSGYPRLDQTALETVLKWRFIAGKKAGLPQKMWVNIPINFVLE
jgi:protein TonB